jgi:hypothetical protein
VRSAQKRKRPALERALAGVSVDTIPPPAKHSETSSQHTRYSYNILLFILLRLHIARGATPLVVSLTQGLQGTVEPVVIGSLAEFERS